MAFDIFAIHPSCAHGADDELPEDGNVAAAQKRNGVFSARPEAVFKICDQINQK
jgi:hypothetical protein